MRFRGEDLVVVAEAGQELAVGWQRRGDGDPGCFQFCPEALVLGNFGAFLAEPFGFMVQRHAPPRRAGQPVNRGRVILELGQQGVLIQGQLVVQVPDLGAGVLTELGGGQGVVDGRGGQSGGLAQPGLPRTGLVGGEQRAGFFQHGERVTVPVGVDHVQELASLIAGPLGHQVIGHLLRCRS